MAERDEHSERIGTAEEPRGSSDGAAGAPSESAQAEEEASKPSVGRRVLKIVLYTLGGLVGLVLVLVLLFVVAIQTNPGANGFAGFILGLANPFDEANIEYSDIRGNFLTGVELHDVRITRPAPAWYDTLDASRGAALDDTLRMAQIDTLRVRYNLLKLLRGTVSVSEITLARPNLWARQLADSSWDLLNPFLPDTSVVDTVRAFDFEVGRIRITDGNLNAQFWPPWKDSTLQVRNLHLNADNLVIAEQTSVVLDTLWAQLSPPNSDAWFDVRAGGALDAGRLALDGFRFESPNSLLTAEGTLQLPDDEDAPIRDIRFTLDADPLAFDDVRFFLPDLQMRGTVEAQLLVTGSTDQLQIDAGAAFSEGGRLAVDGMVNPGAGGTLAYDLDGQIRNFDPAILSGAPEPQALLNADFSVDLRGTSMQLLNGDVSATLFDSRFGTYTLDRTRFNGTFEDGRVRFDAQGGLLGARLSANGTARPFDETPTYDVSGEVRSLDLARFSEAEGGTPSDINARFDVEGAGFDPQTAEIQADLALVNSSINNYRIEDGRFDLTLANGDLDFGTRLLFPEGFVTANGKVTFGDEMEYRVERGRIEDLNLTRLLGQDRDSALNGSFSLQGRGTDPNTATLRADFDLAPSTIEQHAIEGGDLDVRLANGNLTYDADFRSDAGRLAVEGTATFEGEQVRYDVRQGRLENFNLAAFTGDTTQVSNLTGTFTASGVGTDPQSLTLRADVDLDESVYGDYTIRDAAVDLNLRGGTLAFDAAADLDGGAFDVRGTARPFADVLSFEVTQGRFENLDLSRFTQDTTQVTNLTGTFTAVGRGTSLETLNLQADLNLEASRFRAQVIEAGTLALTLRSGELTFDADVTTPEGRLAFAGGGDLFGDEGLQFALRESAFSGVNLASLLDNPALQTSLNGWLTFEGAGFVLGEEDFDPRSGTVSARLHFDRSTINDAILQEGDVTVASRNGFIEADALLAFEAGLAELHASGRFFDTPPTYQATGSLRDVNLAALTGVDTLVTNLTADFAVEGIGTDPQTMTLAGFLAAHGTRYGDVTLDTLYTDFALAEGIVQVDSLLLRSNLATAQAGGRIALFDSAGTAASDFTLHATFDSLGVLRKFIGAEALSLGEGALDARVYGDPGALQFDASTELTSLIYNDIRLAGFDGTLAGTIDVAGGSPRVAMAETDLSVDYFSLPQLTIRQTRLETLYDGDELTFNTELLVDTRREARLAGRIDLRPDSQRVRVEDLALRFDGDRWALLQEASITYGDEYRVSNFLLSSSDQQIAIDGVIDPDGQQNLIVTLEGIRIGALTDLFDYEGLQGTLTGYLDLTGPAWSPALKGLLDLDLESNKTPVGDLNMELAYDSLRLGVQAVLAHKDGSTLRADGSLPMDLRLAPAPAETAVGAGLRLRAEEVSDLSDVDFTLVADSFSIGWIEPFLDPETVDEVEGRLDGSVDVSGTLANPILDGRVVFVGGRIHLPEQGVTYRNINAELEMEANKVLLQHAEMTSGGTLIATGTIGLAELTLGEFDLDLSAEDFLAVDSREYRAVASGDLQVSGTTKAPVLTGNLDLVSADIRLVNEAVAELEPVQLTEADLNMLEQRFGIRVTEADTTTFDIFVPLAMNVNVDMARDVWVRSNSNPEMDIQLTGDVDVRKNAGGELQIFGSIEVLPERSRVIQFGRRFDITEGRITFNGPSDDPLLDIVAQYEVPARDDPGSQVTITLAIDNQHLDELRPELTSSPQMEMTDILSYIATGKPAGEGFALGGSPGGSGVVGFGTDVALSQLTNIIEGIAGSELSLDVIEIEHGLGGTRLTAGKYVTPRLFVAVSQPIANNSSSTSETGSSDDFSPDVTVEYELNNWLLVRGRRIGSVIRLNFIWKYAY